MFNLLGCCFGFPIQKIICPSLLGSNVCMACVCVGLCRSESQVQTSSGDDSSTAP